MAPEIHQRAAARAIYIPEPLAVRAEVLLALLHEVNFSEGAGVGHFLGFEIFWGEEKLFAVHQQDAVFFRDGDHLFAFFNGHRQRLLADDVLARGGTVFGHLGVQAVWRADADHFDVALFEHLAVAGERARDTKSIGKCGGVARRRGGNRDDFRFVRHDLQSRGVNVRLELRSDDADSYPALVLHLAPSK
jgi:hypothetical protein